MGKFNSLKDEVVYRASLDGCDDEVGDVQGFGWHGLVLNLYGKDYIVHEDSQGFVTVDEYEAIATDASGQTFRSAASGNAWCELCDEYALWLGEDEEWTEEHPALRNVLYV
jgi:hypothetical protein